jgi:CHASE2 domain-containing sensor protein
VLSGVSWVSSTDTTLFERVYTHEFHPLGGLLATTVWALAVISCVLTSRAKSAAALAIAIVLRIAQLYAMSRAIAAVRRAVAGSRRARRHFEGVLYSR